MSSSPHFCWVWKQLSHIFWGSVGENNPAYDIRAVLGGVYALPLFALSYKIHLGQMDDKWIDVNTSINNHYDALHSHHLNHLSRCIWPHIFLLETLKHQSWDSSYSIFVDVGGKKIAWTPWRHMIDTAMCLGCPLEFESLKCIFKPLYNLIFNRELVLKTGAIEVGVHEAEEVTKDASCMMGNVGYNIFRV